MHIHKKGKIDMDLLSKAKMAAEKGNWIGESVALAKLNQADREQFSTTKLAEILGRNRAEIIRKVAIGKFPKRLLALLRENGWSYRTSFELLPLRGRDEDTNKLNYLELYKALDYLDGSSIAKVREYTHRRLAEIQTFKFEELLQDFLAHNPHIKVEEMEAIKQLIDEQVKMSLDEIRKNFRNQEMALRHQIAHLKADKSASAAQKVNTFKRDTSNFVAKALLILSGIEDLGTEEVYSFLDDVEYVCKRLNQIMVDVETHLHPNHDGMIIDFLPDSVEQET